MLIACFNSKPNMSAPQVLTLTATSGAERVAVSGALHLRFETPTFP